MKATVHAEQPSLFDLPETLRLRRSAAPVPTADVRTVPAAKPETKRQWTIVVPSPCEWLTANFRGHWRKKARIEKQWREAAYYAAMQVRPPTGLDRVQVDVLFRYVRKPVREIENLRPTLKNCVDGAIGPRTVTKKGVSPGYGLVVDDSDKHLVYGTYAGEKIPATAAVIAVTPWAGEVVLVVTDLTGGASC